MKFFLRYLRLFSWFVRAFVAKHRSLISFSFVVGFLIFLLLAELYPIVIKPLFHQKTKVIAVIGNYTPTTLPSYLQNLISFGLTSIDQSGEATSSIALNWEIKDDGKTYLFKIKNDLFWHDKTKFKASDINYNLKDVTFEFITQDLLKINLKEPFSPLPTILSRPIFKRGLIGLGPYKVTKIKLKGDTLQNMSLTPLTADLPPLEFKFYSTETSAITAFKLGEVNILDRISDVNGFKNWPNLKISSQVYENYNIILFFNTRLPLLQKRTIRQGLAYAIPSFSEEPSNSPLSPRSWAYNPNVKDYSQNQELARSLLIKEGVATASANLTISTFTSFLPYAQKIAQSWDSLGLKTNIRVENSVPGTFDVLLMSQEIPPDPDQYHLWHSTQTTNITGFGSPKIDKLLEDGRRTTDKEKRVQIYKDFQRYLLEEVPAVFLFHPKLYTIERN